MKRGRHAVRPAPLLALFLAAAAAAAAPPAAQPSALWGEAGELWDPETGPMDFSFAGARPDAAGAGGTRSLRVQEQDR